MSAPAIALEQVEVVEGGRAILSVGHLAIAPGEVVGIIGPNGAGKTTLLKVSVGLRRPRSGRVRVLGRAVERLGGFALSRLRCELGYVPQDLVGHGLMPLTVREVVAVGRTGRAGLLRPLGRADWQCVEAWLARLGLERLADAPYAGLSGGEQRKALIARAMVQEPRVLLLDEPAAHLDLGWREQIVATLEELHRAPGPTMLLVSHELELLPACCGRIVLLERGRVQADGPPDEVLTPARIAGLYGPRLRLLRAGGRLAAVPAAEAAP